MSATPRPTVKLFVWLVEGCLRFTDSNLNMARHGWVPVGTSIATIMPISEKSRFDLATDRAFEEVAMVNASLRKLMPANGEEIQP